MTVRDILMLTLLFVGVVAFIALPIYAVLAFESRRARRAMARFTAGLDGARTTAAPGPGAWDLDAIEGRRAGCDVTLRPSVLGRTIAVPTGGATTRMRAMGVELVIHGGGATGRGELHVRRRELVVGAGLAPVPDATRRALIACDAELTVEDGVARCSVALPLRPRVVDELLAAIDAIAPYLRAPAG